MGLGLYYGLGADNTDAARQFMVGPGATDPWLDAAIEVRGIPHEQAGRAPAAIREALESCGADVDEAAWGGGESQGGAATRGKIYIRWQPERPYNAVTYADVAQRIIASAAEGFPAGAMFIMPRYRIDRVWPYDNIYVYPEGGDVPASACAAARRTTAQDVRLAVAEEEGRSLPAEPAEALISIGHGTTVKIAIGVGAGAAGLGLIGLLWWKFGKKRRR